jgi:hypothetical protein
MGSKKEMKKTKPGKEITPKEQRKLTRRLAAEIRQLGASPNLRGSANQLLSALGEPGIVETAEEQLRELAAKLARIGEEITRLGTQPARGLM